MSFVGHPSHRMGPIEFRVGRGPYIGFTDETAYREFMGGFRPIRGHVDSNESPGQKTGIRDWLSSGAIRAAAFRSLVRSLYF